MALNRADAVWDVAEVTFGGPDAPDLSTDVCENLLPSSLFSIIFADAVPAMMPRGANSKWPHPGHRVQALDPEKSDSVMGITFDDTTRAHLRILRSVLLYSLQHLRQDGYFIMQWSGAPFHPLLLFVHRELAEAFATVRLVTNPKGTTFECYLVGACYRGTPPAQFLHFLRSPFRSDSLDDVMRWTMPMQDLMRYVLKQIVRQSKDVWGILAMKFDRITKRIKEGIAMQKAREAAAKEEAEYQAKRNALKEARLLRKTMLLSGMSQEEISVKLAKDRKASAENPRSGEHRAPVVSSSKIERRADRDAPSAETRKPTPPAAQLNPGNADLLDSLEHLLGGKDARRRHEQLKGRPEKFRAVGVASAVAVSRKPKAPSAVVSTATNPLEATKSVPESGQKVGAGNVLPSLRSPGLGRIPFRSTNNAASLPQLELRNFSKPAPQKACSDASLHQFFGTLHCVRHGIRPDSFGD
mmetsp:Transcript_25802/g.66530  ORF Transcript_25802/g.66530 Transcript_25802/m.66530 type:complete len:469 (+) Transcript_25802:452-1858(+)